MNKKIIAIALGGAAVWYFFLRKKTAPATMLPAAAVVNTSLPKLTPVIAEPERVVVVPESEKVFVYPAGLQEGDYVKFGTADPVYLLVNGQRRWISYDWMMANDRNYWDKVKFLESYQALSIPEGPMLTV